MTSVFDDEESIAKKVAIKEKDSPEIEKMIKEATSQFKTARVESGISQGKLAKMAGVPQKVVWQLESGGNFKFSTYAKLSIHIGLKPKVILIKHKRPKIRNKVDQHN